MKKKRSCFGTLIKYIIIFAVIYCAVVFGGRTVIRNVYPIKYEDEVMKASDETGIEPELLFAVIKIESNFDPDAESHAGAMGLMQMMPSTFEWLQEKECKGEILDEDELYDPETSIHYGSLYLKMLIDRYKNKDTALCAYNAGIGTVNEWLSQSEHSEDGYSITDIPYPETKWYVAKINIAYKIYQKYYDMEE